MLTPGTVLQNRYRIVSQLGQGGMGAVYRAWDMRLSVPTALKEMTPQPGLDSQTLGQLRDQFRQEATVLARLNHPHLVRVTDFFEEEGNAYLVMDFVEGQSLADRITHRGALPETEVLAWAEQLLSALAYCHRQGIIHRDIKPQNVIIRSDGQAVLVDFGLVKLWDPSDPHTKTVMRGMGTPEYAPPEQYEADTGHTDPCSDIYSLGATLYHALVGQAPLTATLRMATPEKFTQVRTLNPNISSATETTVMKALELARSKRWQSADEMSAALAGRAPTPSPPPPGDRTEVLPGVQPVTPPTAQPAVQAAAPPRTRRPVWLWILGGVAVLGILICLGSVWGMRELVRFGQAVETTTAEAQLAAMATDQAHATATSEAVQRAATAQAAATTAAQSLSATATAQAQATATARARQATSTPQPSGPTATAQACIHRTALAPDDWAVILCDPFDRGANDWSIGEYEGDLISGARRIENGKYLWEGTANDGVIWWSIPEIANFSDVYLTVEIQHMGGAEDGQYGIIFRRANSDNYGLFKIRDNQQFKFSIRHEGGWETVIAWTESTAIRPGEINRLTVLAEGDHYTFYINDQYIDDTYDARLEAGQVGVAIELVAGGDAGTFEFDNFEVRAP